MGFVKACGAAAMGYWDGEDLPYYHFPGQADSPSATATSASVMAQTYPNRRFLIAATALGNISTNASGISMAEPPTGPSSTVSTPTASRGRTTTPTFPPRPLPAGGRSKNAGKEVVHLSQFFTDAAAGTLPSFSLVDPYTNYSEEDKDISVGEAYAASVINAVHDTGRHGSGRR